MSELALAAFAAETGSHVVDVPREFCFDPGRDTVKPALHRYVKR